VRTKAERLTLPSLPIEVSDLIFQELDIEGVLNLSLTRNRASSTAKGYIDEVQCGQCLYSGLNLNIEANHIPISACASLRIH
jgi:hypothetical protein